MVFLRIEKTFWFLFLKLGETFGFLILFISEDVRKVKILSKVCKSCCNEIFRYAKKKENDLSFHAFFLTEQEILLWKFFVSNQIFMFTCSFFKRFFFDVFCQIKRILRNLEGFTDSYFKEIAG